MDINMLVGFGGVTVSSVLAAGFTAFYLVKRTAERVGSLEKIAYRDGQGLGVMTIESCDACRRVCRERTTEQIDHRTGEIGRKIDDLLKSIEAQQEAVEKYQEVQERRWQVITNHISRSTLVMELLAGRETGLAIPQVQKIVEGMRENFEAATR